MLLKNTTKRVINLGTVVLLPGMNDKNSSSFSMADKQALQEKIECGDVEDCDKKAENDFEEGLSKYNVTDAKTMIENTADENLLNEWKTIEAASKKRKGILEAIAAQQGAIADGLVATDE